MSTYSFFEFEEDDIVKLNPCPEYGDRRGWVNIGVHAVQLELDEDGNLLVTAYARTNEGKRLGALSVDAEAARDEGGVDPDEED